VSKVRCPYSLQKVKVHGIAIVVCSDNSPYVVIHHAHRLMVGNGEEVGMDYVDEFVCFSGLYDSTSSPKNLKVLNARNYKGLDIFDSKSINNFFNMIV